MTDGITEAEVREALDCWYRAFDEPDIEALIANDFSFEDGYGFRSVGPRKPLSTTDARALWETFYEEMDFYDIKIEEVQIKFVGDVAIAWGTHTEKFQRHGNPQEFYKVRFSFTLHKASTGEVNILLAHRDIQEFAQDGRYIPRYT